MDARHLDDLAREIGSQLPRRSVLGALGGLAALLTAPALQGETKKKKKKKKCKGGKRKCGKKCIPADQCCTTADCGSKGECVGGACVCPAGKKACNGGCIPQDACCQSRDCGPMQDCTNGACTCGGGQAVCGDLCISPEVCCALASSPACPGEQHCNGGFCMCPDPGENPCGDGSCVEGSECCVNANCPDGQHCDDGTCWCDGANGIWCGDACCNAGNDEVCITEEDDPTCAGGGCQLIDWCNVEENSVCKNSANQYCICITAFEAGGEEVPACVDGLTIGDSCDTCDTSDNCDAGYVCVQGDTSADGVCGCSGKFCAPLCDAAPERGPARANASARNTGHKEKVRRSR